MTTTQTKFDAKHLAAMKEAILVAIDCVRKRRVEDYADLALCLRPVLDLAIQFDADHSDAIRYFVVSTEVCEAPSGNDLEDWELIAHLKMHTQNERVRYSEQTKREKVYGSRDLSIIANALLVAADAVGSGMARESYQVGMCLHPTVAAAVFNESDIEDAICEFGNVLHFGSAIGWTGKARRTRLVALVKADLHRRLSDLV